MSITSWAAAWDADPADQRPTILRPVSSLRPKTCRRRHGRGRMRGNAPALLSAQLSSGSLGDVRVGVGVAVEAPSTVWGLVDEDPGAVGEARVAGGGGDDVGHLPDHPQLLVAVQDPDRSQDLNADVVAVAIGGSQRIGRQLVDEGGVGSAPSTSGMTRQNG